MPPFSPRNSHYVSQDIAWACLDNVLLKTPIEGPKEEQLSTGLYRSNGWIHLYFMWDTNSTFHYSKIRILILFPTFFIEIKLQNILYTRSYVCCLDKCQLKDYRKVFTWLRVRLYASFCRIADTYIDNSNSRPHICSKRRR